jgi:hypothetical protein
VSLGSPKLADTRTAVREAARAAAMRAGADPARVAVVSAEEKSVAYLAAPTAMLRVRAAGPPRVGWLSGKSGAVRPAGVAGGRNDTDDRR